MNYSLIRLWGTKLKIEKVQHIESAIKQMKQGEVTYRQKDYSVVCNDLSRGMGSLLLQVNQTGAATFRYLQKVNGKRKYIALGNYAKNGNGGITLAEARKLALEYGGLAKKGISVKSYLLEKKAEEDRLNAIQARENKAGSFGQLIDSYIKTMQTEGKRTWPRVLASIEKDVFPVIPRTQKAKSVTDSQIIDILSGMIERGADTQSNRIRSYLHTAFNIGLKHDKDPAKKQTEVLFGLEHNPVAHIPKQKSAEKTGTRYLDKEELKRLLGLLNEGKGISEWTANIIKLCIFTGGQRPYEIVTAKRSKVDFDNEILEISEEYSKNKKSHLIPLTKSAFDIVKWFDERSQFYEAEFLIYKRTNLSEHYRTDSLGTAIARFCEENKFKHFAPRDIRRTCKTHMGSIQLSKEIRDRIQNHAFGDVSSKHYDRWEYLPEKKEALGRWESWLLNLCSLAK